MQKKNYKSIFDQVPIGFFRVSPEGKFIIVNKAIIELLGYNSEKELMNKNFLNHVYYSTRGRKNKPAFPLKPGTKKLWKKDGVLIELHLEFTKFNDSKGKVKYYEGFAFGVSKEKKVNQSDVKRMEKNEVKSHSEKTLTDEKSILERLYQSPYTGIFTFNSDGKFISVNEAFRKILGYSKEELKKFAFTDLIYEEDKISSIIMLNRLKNGEINNYKIEKWFRRKDKKFIWTSIATIAVKDENNNFIKGIATVHDFTKSKNAENELSIKEEYYRTLIENSGDLLTILNHDWTIRYQSPSVQKITGYKLGELSGQNIFDYVHPDDSVEAVKILKAVPENYDDIKTIELRFLHKNGSWCFLEGAVNNMLWNPLIKGYVIDFRDISDRIVADEKLKESEERFRELAENIRDAFTIFNIDDNKILYASPAYSEIWGSNIQDLYKDPVSWLRKIYPADFNFVRKAFRELSKTQTFNIEYRIFKKPGVIRWIRQRAFPIKDKKEKIFRYASIAEDVTEQKLAEEQIRKFSHAIQQNPALIMITDPSGTIEYVNPKFTKVTGYTIEEIKGKNPRVLKSGFTSNAVYNILWKTIKSGGTWQGEIQNKKKNGEPYWESQIISPIVDEQGNVTHFVAVKEDITLRKFHEAQMLEAKERAESSDKLKSEFIAQMSHEIRTPLNNILTYTSLLRDELERYLPPDLETAFDVIKSSANRLVRTIDMILNLSRVQSGNYELSYEEVDLKELLNNLTLEFYNSAKNKELKIDFYNSARLSVIKTDAHLIGQILTNLIDNAIKYTNYGKITIKLYNRDNLICVDVTDTGIGISKNFMTDLFNPFTQEDLGVTRHYEGIGLGLALVKKYAELLYAEIKVKSEKGTGTTFTVEMAI